VQHTLHLPGTDAVFAKLGSVANALQRSGQDFLQGGHSFCDTESSPPTLQQSVTRSTGIPGADHRPFRWPQCPLGSMCEMG